MYTIQEEALKYEYALINSKLIISEIRYQREIKQDHVDAIVKNFNELLVNPPKVSFRNGKYYVFDGQTTLTVLKIRNKGFDLPVFCKVFYDLTLEQEAELFIAQSGIVTKVQSTDKLRAKYNIGDKDVHAIVEIAKESGLVIDFRKSGSDKHIVALGTVMNAYKKYGAAVLKDVLLIINRAWDGKRDSLREEIIGGLAIFCGTYFGRYNRALLIKKLNRYDPMAIVREGDMSRAFGKKKYAQQFLNIYNKNMTNRLEDK